jgi:hypothetical protein
MLAIAMLIMNDATSKRKKYETYQSNVETVLTYLRYARSDAISNRIVGVSTPEGGFGTHIEYLPSSSQLRLIHFVDNNNDLGAGTEDGKYSAGFDTVLDETTMNAFWDFRIQNPQPPIPAPSTEFSTIFLPPNAEMVINDGTAANSYRSAELYFNFSGNEKRICLNRVSRFFEIITKDSCN